MATPKPWIKFTVKDYMSTPEGTRYQLLDGEMIVAPSPISRHQRILFALSVALREFVTRQQGGEVFIAPLDVVLSNYDVAQPDILFVSNARSDIVTEANALGQEAVSVRGSMSTLSVAFALLLAASVARGAFVFAQTYLAERLSQSIAYDFRNDIYDHLQRLSYAYHDNSQIGQIMSRATQDVEGVRMFVSMGVIFETVVGVFLGALALGETLGGRVFAGLALVGLSVYLVTARPKPGN